MHYVHKLTDLFISGTLNRTWQKIQTAARSVKGKVNGHKSDQQSHCFPSNLPTWRQLFKFSVFFGGISTERNIGLLECFGRTYCLHLQGKKYGWDECIITIISMLIQHNCIFTLPTSTLNKQAVCSSEMLTYNYQFTRCHNPEDHNLCNKSNVIQSYKGRGGRVFSAGAAKLFTVVIFGLEQAAKHTHTLRIITTTIVIGIRGLKGNFCFIFWKITEPFGIGKMFVLLQY